jgi:site-specific recombinase XerD
MVQNNQSWEWLFEGFRFELEARTKPKTVEYYCGHLKRFLRWLEAVDITNIHLLNKRDIQLFFHQLTQSTEIAVGGHGSERRLKRTENTRWPYYRSLKQFFNWAANEGHIDYNPMDGIVLKPPRAPVIEPYTTEQKEKMLRVLDYEWRAAKTPRQKMLAARDKAILCLFLESGLRLGELTSLCLSDIALKEQRLIVRDGKMDKGRLAGFGPQTKSALWKYLGLRPETSKTNKLWLTEELRPLSEEGVYQIISRIKIAAGLGHLKGTVHKLRHTWATTHLRHTRDLKGTKILLGHSTYAMVDRYTQYIDAEDALASYESEGPLDWMKG